MYHHEVMINLSEIYQAGLRNRDNRVAVFKPIINKMLNVSEVMTPPNRMQLASGDSDVESLIGVQNYGRLITERPLDQLGDNDDQLLTLELYGAFPALFQAPVNKPLDAALKNSGHYFLRSDWTPSGTYLHMKNGYVGSGHGHEDLLHFDLTVHGQNVFVDRGRFTYKAKDPQREVFKSASSHNTIVFDRREFTIQTAAWGTGGVATAVQPAQYLNRNIDLIQGLHLGYFPDAVVSRQIVYIKPDLFVIVDALMHEGTHEVDRYFYLDPDITSRLSEQTVALDSSNEHLADMYFTTPVELTSTPTVISQTYNKITPATFLRANSLVKGSQILPFVIQCTDGPIDVQEVAVTDMNGELVSDRYVKALKIIRNKDIWIVVANVFEQPDSRKLQIVDDVRIFGKTVVIHKVAGERTEITMIEG